ncbi:hypothetical protein [Paludisphaera rhizosphaerae]|uniref:hypothetical protein n=1 Tax=Paludisphaera rhizosphaerae TaxID=2711216 RepID=UPI0013E9F748|nr:hypothetical protein [Paludisphaera rhizosphaerae]
MIPSCSRDRVARRPSVRPILAFLAASVLVGEAHAQGYGPDPFRPYNSQYDPYVFGVAPGALDGVGNPSINRAGIRNANQFRSVVNELNGIGVGNRHDQVNRRYDTEYGRIYRPNAKTDKNSDYETQRAQAADLYFRYLREKDPRKRAQLLREYNKAQSETSRDLAASPNSRNARRRSSDTTPSLGGTGAARRAADRDADHAPPPPDSVQRGPSAGAREDLAPPPPDSVGRGSFSSRPGARRPKPIAPGDEPIGATPSEVLERATRSGGSSAPPPPPLP